MSGLPAAGVPPGGANAETLLPIEEALARILAGAVPLPAETVPLGEAAGRVLAHAPMARVTLPPWDNTAMDGFAVRSVDVARAAPDAPVTLRVTGEVAAGHAPVWQVAAGDAVRVTTGAMMPPGADAVVPVEDTDADPGVAILPGAVSVLRGVGAGEHVRRAGDDLVAGTPLLEPGRVVGPAAFALLTAAGVEAVEVRARPRVAVVATGDELVPPGQPLGPAQIYDSNSGALALQATAAGAAVRDCGIAPDDFDALLEQLRDAASAADVVLVSGGVSVGAHDLVKRAFAVLGSVDFWRVAVQPGKPLAFGRMPRGGGRGDVSLFGLPGNPVSAFVTFELFVRPLLRRLGGRVDGTGRPVVRAILAEPVAKSTPRRAFLRVSLERGAQEGMPLRAHLAGGQGSHVLSSLAAASGLAVIPEGVPGLPAGAGVDVLLLDDEGA